jgi:hypothetical protein
MHADDAVQPISRRKMLKRLGAGAAVAWSAPVLTSLRTPAFAQYPARCAPIGAICGPRDPACGGASGCPECVGTQGFCVALDDGSCFCAQGGACNFLPGEPICQTDSDCAEFGQGTRCAPTSCDECAGNRACVQPCLG